MVTAVDTGVVLLLRGGVVHERLDLLRIDAPDIHGRLVRRRRRHREHRAVARIERDERAAVRVVGLVLPGGGDPVPERALGGPLEPDVDGQPHRVPGPRLALRLERPLRAAERVDPDLRLAGLAAEELVELRLDAGLADLVARAVQPRPPLQVALRHLADVPEHLRREGLVRVVPQIGLLDLDARELGLVLVEVRDLVLADRGLHRDRVERIGDPLVDLLREPRRRHLQHPREPLDDVVAALLRQVAHPELHGGAGDVVHDGLAIPVEDRAAGSLDADRAELVPLRRGEVRVARQHLERPEPEEEHREDHERDDPENADAEREPRRQPVRRLDPRIGWQEPRRRVPPLAVRGVAHTSSTRRAGSYCCRGAITTRHSRQDRQHEEGRQERTREERDERLARGDRLTEEEVDRDAAEAGADRDGEGGDGRRVPASAAGRLAVAARPVAGRRQDDRGRSQHAERHHVDEQSRGESRPRAGDRPCDEADRDHGDEQQVRLRAENPGTSDRGDLQDRRHEHERRDAESDGHPAVRSAGTRTSTACSEDMSANGSTCTWV